MQNTLQEKLEEQLKLLQKNKYVNLKSNEIYIVVDIEMEVEGTLNNLKTEIYILLKNIDNSTLKMKVKAEKFRSQFKIKYDSLNKEGAKNILSYYGIKKQLKHFNSEIFELNEAIIKRENAFDYSPIYLGEDTYINDIKEEMADVYLMFNQFMMHFNIKIEELDEIANKKIDRQLDRIIEERMD